MAQVGLDGGDELGMVLEGDASGPWSAKHHQEGGDVDFVHGFCSLVGSAEIFSGNRTVVHQGNAKLSASVWVIKIRIFRFWFGRRQVAALTKTLLEKWFGLKRIPRLLKRPR